MIHVAYRSAVLIGSLFLLLMLTIQLWYTANNAAVKLDAGSQQDTGTFPKRSRNVNAWYLSNPTDGTNGENVYPALYNPSGAPRRIGIPRTTACPVFRAQDNGSVDPPVIG